MPRQSKPAKTPPSRRVLVRRFVVIGLVGTILAVAYRQALPWSWGYFATIAGVAFATIAIQRRGWVAPESMLVNFVMIGSLTLLQRVFYRELPDTWPKMALVMAVAITGMCGGMLLGLAVAESESAQIKEP